MRTEQAEGIASKYGIDLIKTQFKAMMMGFLMAVVVPGVYIFVAYLMNESRKSTEPSEFLEMLFWVAIALSIIEVIAAFFFRKYLFSKPMILAETSFATDFEKVTRTNNIVILSFCDSIAIYGLMQFMLGAELEIVGLFAILCVISFQILRFRGPFLEQAVVTQHQHVLAGRFRKQA